MFSNSRENHDAWQKLLWLDSRDIVRENFHRIHGRELNDREARQINSAAKQAREYFRNANNSDYSVRPLLTFYGVASLSRALLLLLKCWGGEESLKSGHGLETFKWKSVLCGEPSIGLANLKQLKVRTTKGLFADFQKYTQGAMCIHINSGAVQWRIRYDASTADEPISVDDLFSRIPDLWQDYSNVAEKKKFSVIHNMTFDGPSGFRAKVQEDDFVGFESAYKDWGYEVTTNKGGQTNLAHASRGVLRSLPIVRSFLCE